MKNEISLFNPLKVYHDTSHIEYLDYILSYVDKKICFYGDEVGYFFSPFRRKFVPNICLTKQRYGILFNLFKEDINYAKVVFKSFTESFDMKLIPYYEEGAISDANPLSIAYKAFILSLLSKNINDEYSNYLYDEELIHNTIKNMTKYSIEKNGIFWETLPSDNFIVSYEKPFSGEGILITKQKKNLDVLKEIDRLKYYYQSGGEK